MNHHTRRNSALTSEKATESVPRARQNVRSAGAVIAMALGALTAEQRSLTGQEIGMLLATRLDRAGLITEE